MLKDTNATPSLARQILQDELAAVKQESTEDQRITWIAGMVLGFAVMAGTMGSGIAMNVLRPGRSGLALSLYFGSMVIPILFAYPTLGLLALVRAWTKKATEGTLASKLGMLVETTRAPLRLSDDDVNLLDIACIGGVRAVKGKKLEGLGLEERYGLQSLLPDLKLAPNDYLEAAGQVTAQTFPAFLETHADTIEQWEAWHEPLLARNDPDLTPLVREKRFGPLPDKPQEVKIGDLTLHYDPKALKAVPLYCNLREKASGLWEFPWDKPPCTEVEMREAIDMLILKGDQVPSLAWRQRHATALFYLDAPSTWTQDLRKIWRPANLLG